MRPAARRALVITTLMSIEYACGDDALRCEAEASRGGGAEISRTAACGGNDRFAHLAERRTRVSRVKRFALLRQDRKIRRYETKTKFQPLAGTVRPCRTGTGVSRRERRSMRHIGNGVRLDDRVAGAVAPYLPEMPVDSARSPPARPFGHTLQ
jgi:hypothetical protein